MPEDVADRTAATRRYVIETNNMTVLGVGKGLELN
jgi:hypothetical protein